MKRILTLTAVAAMVFTACSKEESTGTGDKQVRITPDDRQSGADAGKHVVRYACDGHRFRAER